MIRPVVRPASVRSFPVLLVFLVALALAPRADAREPAVAVVDVGQGDSVLVVGSDGRSMLVDAGPIGGATADRIQAAMRREGVSRLDTVVISHAHTDHFGGLPELIDRVPVGQVLYGTRVHTPLYGQLEKQISSARIPYKHVFIGDRIPLGTGVAAEVLHVAQEELPAGTVVSEYEHAHILPDGTTSDEEVDGVNLNAYSVVLRLTIGSEVMLLTGDANTSVEQWLLANVRDLRARVLKVGHHGSATSSTAAFLAAVKPASACISVGAGNEFGHPTREVLARLEAVGARVFRTDQSGSLEVTPGAEGLSVHPLGFATWSPVDRRLRLFERLNASGE